MEKVIIFTNADWHFYAHLLPIALEAKNQGYQVKILTSISHFKDKIEQHGLEVIPIKLKRSSLNPFAELFLLIRIIKIIRKEAPDILHNLTIKPILYGSIAAFVCKTPKVINNFLGMGTIFISNQLKFRLIKFMISKTLNFISNYKKMLFIVQNRDDEKLLSDSGFSKHSEIIAQCSVGINTKEFGKLTDPQGPIIFALLARMIVDKGIYEFVNAARILKKKGINAEFWLVGEPDKDNKNSLTESELKEYDNKGYIKYLGFCSDIKKIWEKAHVAVLPSYREGLSRSLLEAGAFCRAIITTDAPGGRDLVKHNETGLLVKPGDVASLSEAMELLAQNENLRKNIARNVYNHIITNYDASLIAKKTVSLYLK
ncbi:MAG: alpha-D-QuiNAc alpha,3-galactosyltransferase [Rickettsiaceae bacterium]|jgi:glycosyltransferase involved in cell wall biosynthesis|nr:alpha-D-QuiNAc alpha,3-galactosyltransferase [Rickettsiaceae bacterium]